MQKLQRYARDDGRSLFTLTPMVLQTDEIKGPGKRGLTKFIDQINLWRDRHNNGMSHTDLAQTILDESGYTDMLQKDRSPQAQTRLDTLKELILAYVGITRAREVCRISFVANRQSFGRWQSVLPSRFGDELPADHVEAEAETGYSSLPGSEDGFTGTVEDLGERSNYTSPGWRRLKENATRYESTPVIDGKATLMASETGQSGFKLGERVFHEKFGYGKVVDANGTKLTVAFEKAGLKKVISTFVTGA